MPQGLQVWDATGTMIVDTSTFILKDVGTAVVENTSTSTAYVSITVPPASTILVQTQADMTNTVVGGAGDVPTVLTDLANNRVSYKFEATGSSRMRVTALAY